MAPLIRPFRPEDGAGARLAALALIMTVVAVVVGGVIIGLLYQAAFEGRRENFAQIALGQAQLMASVARFDQIYSNDYPEGAASATLSQILEALPRFQAFGRTGELVLGRRVGDRIVFISENDHQALGHPPNTAWESPEAVGPMRHALEGRTGTMVARDSRGVRVLAAYRPVPILDLGLVIKMDLAEIREDFIGAGLIAAAIALVVILGGIIVFAAVSNPLIRKIRAGEDRLRQLTARLEGAREQERKEIAAELHDDLGGILTRIRMILAAQRKGREGATGGELRAAFDLTQQAIGAMRDIIASLRPKILDQLGLMAALQWQARRFEEHFGIPCVLSPGSQNVRLGEQRETLLFRIAQEALTNVAKHAEASEAVMALTLGDRWVVLAIVDDGRGIPVEKIMDDQGIGIQSMRERARQVGGELDIGVGPSGGAAVTARIPRQPGDRVEAE